MKGTPSLQAQFLSKQDSECILEGRKQGINKAWCPDPFQNHHFWPGQEPCLHHLVYKSNLKGNQPNWNAASVFLSGLCFLPPYFNHISFPLNDKLIGNQGWVKAQGAHHALICTFLTLQSVYVGAREGKKQSHSQLKGHLCGIKKRHLFLWAAAFLHQTHSLSSRLMSGFLSLFTPLTR